MILPNPRPVRGFRRYLIVAAATAPALWAQTAPNPSLSTAPASASSGPQPTPPVETVSGDAADREQAFQLSPFVVSDGTDKGYLAASALSGTRLNTSIEDIPAALSVVTKQQLLDTASADINDVFLYEANTEGAYQWTSFTNDRGTVSDDISANPQGVTRIRGLTAANVATGMFASVLPFDTYNVDSLEISRGPNSSVFGIGNTGGSVNVNIARANLTTDTTTFTTRGDTYGGYRGTFDINRPIVKDVAAVRVMGLYNSQGFLQKPSSDITRRLEEEITLHPFKSTTIRASYESYRNFANDPNSMTPEDGISDWIANGKPTYNPLNETVTTGGVTSSPITAANEAALLPYSLAPTNTAFTQYPSWYIDHGQVQLAEINAMPSSTGTGPNNVSGTNHLLQNDTFYDRYTTTYPLYRTPGITNKALYDWTSVSLASPNYANTKGETSQIELEQFFLHSPTQTLALQTGWQRQREVVDNRDFLGSYSGGKYEVLMDVDQYLLDGRPNPYFLRPYLGASQPSYTKGYNDSDIYRGTLAYELNFDNKPNWLHWLGKHRLTGYGEYDSYYTASLGYKDTLTSLEPWMGAAPSSRNSASYRQYLQYYVGGTGDYKVDYGPKGLAEPPITTDFNYYNAVTQTWVSDPLAQYDSYYYANRPNRRLLSSFGGVWQGFLLDDHIIPTIGMRHDFNRTHDVNSAINPTAATNGYYDTSSFSQYTAYDWVKDSGDTYSQGVVVKTFPWLNLLYNQSDSFSPGSLAYDVYGNPLPDPHGVTRDYGFQLNLFHGKLSIRAQQYETTDYGRGSSTINTIVQRADRMDYATSSGDPGLTGWLTTEVTEQNPTWTAAQVEAQVTKLAGVDPNVIAQTINKTHGDQSIAHSRGKEIEIEYNPTRFWTMKSTLTQTEAFNGTMSGAVQNYINQRMPTWTTITGPYTGTLWWTAPIGGSTPQAFFTANVLAPLDLAIDTQGKLITQTSEYHANFITNYRLAGLGFDNWLKNMDVGGAFRWASRISIGYYGAAPDPDGVVRNLDPNRPVWQDPKTSIDMSLGYNLRFFNGKIRTRLQLNVRNVFEGGHLQPVAVNPDGTPWAFRIVNPREAFFTATFSL